MCGIAGWVATPGQQVDRSRLEAMVAALRHRGPDGSGVETFDNVGLAHTRLAIVDPSPAGAQPMALPSGRWVLVYNGEIFNHMELREQLPPLAYRGHSDTETLLHGLDAWGVDVALRCNGLFAFAALDRAQGILWLVRDHFGIKPLYVARTAEGVAFASEIAALLDGGVSRRPNVAALRHALELGWVNGPETPVADVTRIAPGAMVAIDVRTLNTTEKRWFDPVELVDSDLAADLERRGSAAVDLVDEALRASVKRRLMADVPLGTMCSGGVDSSLVTAFAHDEVPSLVAYNVSVPDQPELDEGPWATMVAEHLGIELRTVSLSTEAWRAGVVDAVAHFEYPLTHEASVPLAQIAALARGDGVKVLLSGEGADEVFGGYPWLHQYDWNAFYTRRRPLRRARGSLARSLRRMGLRPDRYPEPRRGPCTAANSYDAECFRVAYEAYRHHRGPVRRLEGKLLAEFGVYLPQVLARQDKNTMQGSIETRPPFLETDVVRIGVNMTISQRVEPRRKAPLRVLADRYLPTAIAARQKVGFNFETKVFQESAEPNFLRQGMLRDVVGDSDGTWMAQIERTLSRGALLLMSGEVWCRIFLDGASPASVQAAMWRQRTVAS